MSGWYMKVCARFRNMEADEMQVTSASTRPSVVATRSQVQRVWRLRSAAEQFAT